MIKKLTICGAGTMGHGIAQVSAQNGYTVALYDLSDEQLLHAKNKVTANLDKGIARGKLSPETKARCLANLSFHTDLEEACQACDLFIEAVPENLALKHRIFKRADACTGEHTILGSNTSSISIAKIAQVVKDPTKVIGTHFFNPVHIMKLLEIVVHPGTASPVLAAVQQYALQIQKESILVKDSPGFATSRLGVALGMEAIRMFEEGVASAADIDKAMVLGYKHPIGPLKLTDLVGLDIRLAIGEYLYTELGNPAFDPPAIMREMVKEGKLGKKTGQGFYSWEGGDKT